MNRSRKDLVDSLREEIKALKLAHIEDIKQVRKEIVRRERLKVSKRVREMKKKQTKKITPILSARTATIQTKITKRVKGKAVLLADKRVQYLRMKNVVYVDGALCYPVILAYAKTLKITPNEMQFLILLNVFKEGRPSFFKLFGLNNTYALNAMNGLTEKGMAERFGGKKSPVFAPSVKGKRAFLDFRQFYRETITRGVFNEKLTTRHKYE